MFSEVPKVIIPAILTFAVAIILVPFFADFLYKNRLWKRRARKDEVTTNPEDEINPDFKRIHNDAEQHTPRIGGVLIWGSVLITIGIFWIISQFVPENYREIFDFMSRGQTALPLFALIIAGMIGLVDDILQIFGGSKVFGRSFADGINRYYRVLIVIAIALVGALWFYFKLDISSIAIPLTHARLEFGIFFIPFFVIVVLGSFSSSVIDGIDGLSGGVLAIIYGAFATIAYFYGLYDVAALCAAIVGGILAFLWFNVPPARFYMGETGMLGLTITLAIISFITDSVLMLPIIAIPLVATSVSSLTQLASKRWFGKKVFRVAPLHHHFEAIGWSRPKIVMRYWILSFIFAVIGIIIVLI